MVLATSRKSRTFAFMLHIVSNNFYVSISEAALGLHDPYLARLDFGFHSGTPSLLARKVFFCPHITRFFPIPENLILDFICFA